MSCLFRAQGNSPCCVSSCSLVTFECCSSFEDILIAQWFVYLRGEIELAALLMVSTE